MGMFDKAQDLADKAGDAAKQNADKLPGDMGDKASNLADKFGETVNRLSGTNPAEDTPLEDTPLDPDSESRL